MKLKNSTIFIFFLTIILALLLKLFVFDFLYVSGTSMVPSINPSTIIFQYKLKWGIPVPFSNSYLVRWSNPQVGDIIIYPWLGRLVIKRCIGVQNDQLLFVQNNGFCVIVHNKIIPLTKEQYDVLCVYSDVPEGMIFAVGDNMPESKDSRDYGFVSIDSIRGTALWK